MPEFKTASGVIVYEISGQAATQAPTITLLHNFMSTGRAAWGSIAPALAEHYRLLIPDLPGHGRSQGYPPGFQHKEMARQVAALIQAEGAQDGHLAGCSSGGMIAQLLVHQGLMRPQTLTLVSTTYSTNPATTHNPNRITVEDFKAGANWMEATARLHDPHHYAGYYAEVLLAGFRKLTGASAIDLALDDLRTWPMPVCIIHGAEDEFFPPSIVEAMAQALPDAELNLIPEQTHALLFRQPWQVRQIMLDFLTRHRTLSPHALIATPGKEPG
jgi:3-oxoadipate enol-lactonase